MSDVAVASSTVAAALKRANATARPAMAANFTHPEWRMSESEFRAFWRVPRMTSVATVGKNAWPHAAPLEVSLEGDVFVVPSFADSVRLADLGANPRLVLNSWDDAYRAAIVYGRATFDAGATGLVRIEVVPTRIYAIRAPEGHHAFRPLN